MKETLLVVLFLSLSICCTQKNVKSKNESKLKLISEIKLQIPEPSGLAISDDGKFLWTVSDENNTIYAFSFEGKILRSIKLRGKNLDLEGITVVDDTTIAVIYERLRTVVLINHEGKVLKSKKLDLHGEENSGIEGITYDRESRKFYLVNEKQPQLLIELDNDLNIIKKTTLNFAADYSAIEYDDSLAVLWMLSDEDQTLFECNTEGKVINSYKLNIEQPEGVAVDNKNQKIFIVSDPTSKFYIYSKKNQ
ncbi:MAG: SdiA-regulated domain-containing protein [bacterium]